MSGWDDMSGQCHIYNASPEKTHKHNGISGIFMISSGKKIHDSLMLRKKNTNPQGGEYV
jgi:hypothetical protein